MGRLKGQPKTGGRKAGTPNKINALLKDSILMAAVKAGNRIGVDGETGLVAYLEKQAVDNPGPFLTLLGKVLPMQVTAANDEPLFPQLTVQFVSPDGSYISADGNRENVRAENEPPPTGMLN